MISVKRKRIRTFSSDVIFCSDTYFVLDVHFCLSYEKIITKFQTVL